MMPKKESAKKYVFILSFFIFLFELLIMVFMEDIIHLTGLPEIVLDPILLVSLLSPALYFFILKPLNKNIIEKESALNKLKEANKIIASHSEELEAEVFKQTKALNDELILNKMINEKLRLFSRGVEQSANSIVITNLVGDIQYVNPKFCELTGYSFEEVKGKNPRILKSDYLSPDVYKNLWETISNDGEWRGEFRNKKKNGEVFWELASISPIKNDLGQNTHYIGVKEDITLRKQAEEKLTERNEILKEQEQKLLKNAEELKLLNKDLEESNSAKDKFFSIISHDLKGPFFPLLGHSQTLDESMDELTTEEIKESVQAIREISEQLYAFLNELLEWSRIQTGRIDFEPKEFDISQTSNSVVSLLNENAKAKSIELKNLIPNGQTVFADANMIQTVIRNFVSNAIKFTWENGQVEISFSKHDDKYGIVTVTDNGKGMTEEENNMLFRMDVQHTTLGTDKEQGTGMGLILCKDMIEKNNGKIWVESNEGKGSKFHFTVPIIKF